MTDGKDETIGGPASDADKKTGAARTTVRERKPAKAAKAKGGKRDAGQDSAQKANADRTENEKTDKDAREKSMLISTKLQTREHVGKHPDEPDKHEHVEAAKVKGVKTEKIKVKFVNQKVDGEHVDTIAFPADGPKPEIGGNHPLSEGQKVQAAIDES